MKKNLLIGSIISVTILILVSFTSVVGYRSGASDVKASPLFNIRSSRAIDEESVDLSCAYVGKGDNINLLIPKLDSNTASINEVIVRISKMDDETLIRFITLLINKIYYGSEFKDANIDEIINSFLIIKNNPVLFKKKFVDDKKDNAPYKTITYSETIPTYCSDIDCISVRWDWKPGCAIEKFLLLIFYLVFWPIILIYWFVIIYQPPSWWIPCDTTYIELLS